MTNRCYEDGSDTVETEIVSDAQYQGMNRNFFQLDEQVMNAASHYCLRCIHITETLPILIDTALVLMMRRSMTKRTCPKLCYLYAKMRLQLLQHVKPNRARLSHPSSGPTRAEIFSYRPCRAGRFVGISGGTEGDCTEQFGVVTSCPPEAMAVVSMLSPEFSSSIRFPHAQP